ncbi:MAG: hypothetical protein ACOCP8_10350 [archaeon]
MFKIKNNEIINNNYRYTYWIVYFNNGLSFCYSDEIARSLNIDLDKYFNLGIKCGGKLTDIKFCSLGKELYFDNKKDAEKFISQLEPYELLIKLRGE